MKCSDLAIYSGSKAIEGPTSGNIAGKRKYVEWTQVQLFGIGRSMKVGKETTFGLLQALEEYTVKEDRSEAAIIPVESAIALVRDMGGNALKYFPMQGLSREVEYRSVAKACAETGFALEPTGGIDMDNFVVILQIALEAGVPQVIPHVYSSIIDKESGLSNIPDVRDLLRIMKKLTDQYA